MLYLYLFNHAEWDYLYQQNCSIGLTDEWSATSPPNIPIGVLYMMIGIVCELLYIPFMIVMIRPEFIQYSCYKFMFLLGVIDMLILSSNSIVSGVQSILGLNYCSHPSFFYVVGVISTSGWYGAGMTCILLAVNRFCEMLAPRISKILFNGKKIYIWLTLPIIYIFFTFSQNSGIYNTKYYAFNFPFYGEDDFELMKHISLTFHCIHNISLTIVLGITYGALCVLIGIKSRVFKDAPISKVQIKMTLQSMCICLEMFFAAIVYVFNVFIPLPHILLVFAHACWICVHGDTPIVYLMLNKTLRKAVFELVGISKQSNRNNNIIKNSSLNQNTSNNGPLNGGPRRLSSAQAIGDQGHNTFAERNSNNSIEPRN